MLTDFCPLVVHMLKWKLYMHHPLRMWVERNVTLLGDVCYLKLPHLDQACTEHLVEELATSGCALHLMGPEVQAARDEVFHQVK
ncbi:hypothetical protein DFH08DRAFT_963190 [Mycena albidolilacea]|uniref:Uncharacterized protein n=1 Tax=Mycena albidolilacea TaxID=1033008 RepID=A0AAD6ZVH3_9AGAR|nr:hypothetical protein DFH08DRAFT_963190 [Mycena albidolilacea]